MKNRINQLKHILKDVFYVSKLTGTLNKKLIIFSIILTSNLTVLLDILIILAFTLFLTGKFETFQFIEIIVNLITENIYQTKSLRNIQNGNCFNLYKINE